MRNVLLLIIVLFCVDILAQDKPNIIFIEVDDLPPHYTTLQGLQTANTPSIDKLADEGIYFKNAIAQGTMCGPSRNSLIVGKYPHNIGFYENGRFVDIPNGTWTLPAALQRAGYYTAHIGKSHIHPSKDGISGSDKAEINRKAHEQVLGFNYVWNSLGRSVARNGDKLIGKDMYINFLRDYDANHGTSYYNKLLSKEKMSTLPDDIYLDGLYTKMALEFIDEHKNETYLLWLNYSVPHGPYDVEESYHTFNLAQVPTPNFIDDTGIDIPDLLRPNLYKPDRQEDNQLGNMANISYMDSQVSRVLDAIEASGNKEKTIVVFFSDHGILIGDHGLEHKSTLYKEVLNPTLIIYDPRNQGNNARIVTRPVELIDILKTTMDFACCSAEDKNSPYGESLTPLLKDIEGYTKIYAVGECPGYFAYVTEKYKYIAPFDFQEDGFEVLFDLNADPNERVNIAKSSPLIIEEYRVLADKWLASAGDVVLQGQDYVLSSDKMKETQNRYNIFPNPVSNILTVSGTFKQNSVISLHSIDGREVFVKQVKRPPNRRIQIDMDSLYSGTYILKINNVAYTVIKQ